MLGCHDLGIWLGWNEEGALGREWIDKVVWVSALFGGGFENAVCLRGLGFRLGKWVFEDV